jgi:PAS domain S-box-containing protein
MSSSVRGEGSSGAPGPEALRALSLALEQSPLAVVMTRCDASIQYANPRFCELTGYDACDISFLKIFDLSAGGGEEYLMWSVISKGDTWQGELPGRRQNGHRFWASVFVAPVRDETGELTYYLGVFDEIPEPHVEFPADRAPDIVVLLDVNGKILYTNRTVAGMTREQVTGATVFSYVPPNHQERMRGYIELAIRTKRPVSYEIPSAGPHGTTDYYLSQLIPIERDGDVIALSIATIDLSRRASQPQAPPRRSRRPARRRPSRDVAQDLSVRESQVLELLVEGLTNRQVAQRLKVSLRTVDHHVSHILKKLAVPNRTAAALAARRTGLL